VDTPWIYGVVSEPDQPHAIGIARVRVEAVLFPGNRHRPLPVGVLVHVLVCEVLVETVRCLDLDRLASVHSSDEVTEVFNIGPPDRTHVLFKDVGIFGYIPADEFFNHWIGIIFHDWSLGIVMGSPIA